MRFRYYLLFIAVLFSFSVTAQRVTLSGYVKDANTGESLIGAGVITTQTNAGAYTNEYGYYSLGLAPGATVLRVSYLGYNQVDTTLNLTADTRFNLELKPKAREIKEVVVKAQREDHNVQSTEMGKVQTKCTQLIRGGGKGSSLQESAVRNR